MLKKRRRQESKKGPNKPGPNKQREWRSTLIYLVLTLAVISVITTYVSDPKSSQQIGFSEFIEQVDKGQIQEVTIRSSESVIVGRTKGGKLFKTYFVDYPEFVSELREKGVDIEVDPTNSNWMWSVFLQAFLPFILIALLWFFIFRQAQGANNQALSFGKSRAVPWKKSDNKQQVTFKDVAGVDEAVEELEEIVGFLKNPEKYQKLGARIPKGALLMGPPGTGKTLLAKAIAGEADVPFFNLSGSDFVEMFVGVGASRVRDLFNQAKKNQPSIIFVDEIDAVGRHRGAGLGGGHDEREQTLNQLLVEMDGFGENTSVIIISATNRPDILDPALLRPGRFDRQIVVDKPDVKGRIKILEIHAKNKKIDKKVDLEILAKRTPGFTGADLANLVNEAALLAARRNQSKVTMSELEESVDRVLAGPERKSRLISPKEKEIVAFHEVGHALVAHYQEYADPVHKISILPRGMALGYTLQLPIEDKMLVSKEEIEAQIQVLMGGRIAEDLKTGQITSGASNDIQKATEIARSYVCNYGMSNILGNRKYGNTQHQVFLGKDYSDHSKDYSEDTASLIDKEIRKLIDTQYAKAKKVIVDHMDELNKISALLIEKEVIEAEEFEEILGPKKINGQAPKKRKKTAEKGQK